MAKVVITVDTDAASITASVNGKTVDDIKSIGIYKMVDSYSKNKTPEVDVMISSSVEENGVRITKHICCENTTMGKLAANTGGVKTEYEGFITNNIPSDNKDFSQAGASVREALMKRVK